MKIRSSNGPSRRSVSVRADQRAADRPPDRAWLASRHGATRSRWARRQRRAGPARAPASAADCSAAGGPCPGATRRVEAPAAPAAARAACGRSACSASSSSEASTSSTSGLSSADDRLADLLQPAVAAGPKPTLRSSATVTAPPAATRATATVSSLERGVDDDQRAPGEVALARGEQRLRARAAELWVTVTTARPPAAGAAGRAGRAISGPPPRRRPRARARDVEARAGPRRAGARPARPRARDRRARRPAPPRRRAGVARAGTGTPHDPSTISAGPAAPRHDRRSPGRERLEHGDPERLALGAVQQAARARQVAARVVDRAGELDRAGEVGLRRARRAAAASQRSSRASSGAPTNRSAQLRRRPPGERDTPRARGPGASKRPARRAPAPRAAYAGAPLRRTASTSTPGWHDAAVAEPRARVEVRGDRLRGDDHDRAAGAAARTTAADQRSGKQVVVLEDERRRAGVRDSHQAIAERIPQATTRSGSRSRDQPRAARSPWAASRARASDALAPASRAARARARAREHSHARPRAPASASGPSGQAERSTRPPAQPRNRPAAAPRLRRAPE